MPIKSLIASSAWGGKGYADADDELPPAPEEELLLDPTGFGSWAFSFAASSSFIWSSVFGLGTGLAFNIV